MPTPAPVAFAKLEGLANDFMLIEVDGDHALPSGDCIRAWADRRTGVGFDQLLALMPDDTAAAHRVRIFNADGSEAEQCGNGMRAIAAWLDHRGRLQPDLELRTAAGPVRLSAAGDGRYRADLPGARPLTLDALGLPAPELIDPSRPWRLVSLGNPHLVIDWPTPPSKADLLDASAMLNKNPAWRDRVNLGLAHRHDDHTVELRVYERGAGPTPACGSGACAAAVALMAGAPTTASESIEVRQPGGTLVINLNVLPGQVRTIGPARVVFKGQTA